MDHAIELELGAKTLLHLRSTHSLRMEQDSPGCFIEENLASGRYLALQITMAHQSSHQEEGRVPPSGSGLPGVELQDD